MSRRAELAPGVRAHAERARAKMVRAWRGRNTVSRQVRGEGNTISYDGAHLSAVIFDVEGDHNQVRIDAGCVLKNVRFHIRGDGHSVVVAPGCHFGGGTIWVEDSGSRLEIGAGSSFENVDLALTEPDSRITIGRDCMFAYDIDVRNGDSHSIIDAATGERLNPGEEVTIGDHVWVGAHCIILKGSTIAPDSVVAAGSVVTGRHGRPGVVLGGNPARELKTGITWTRPR